MVMQAPANFIDTFDAEVHRLYEASDSLRNTVRFVSGVLGKSHSFPVVGGGTASKFIRGNDVVVMNQARKEVKSDLEDWSAFDMVYKPDLNKINFNETSEVAEGCVSAIARRENQLIIDAAKAVIAADNTIGAGTGALTVKLLTQLKAYFDKRNVPLQDRHILTSAIQLQQLLNDDKANSIERATIKSLVNGELDYFVGFHFKTIGDYEEGGLPVPGTNMSLAIAYQKKAVGLAVGQDRISSVEWVPLKRGWLVGCDYTAGGVAIDKDGIAAVKTLDTASV
jgi:hypothetical protein